MRGVVGPSLCVLLLVSCPGATAESPPARPGPAKVAKKREAEDERLRSAREKMVTTQIEERGIDDPRVLAALREVPRHRFVPEAYRAEAHGDHPLPIGHRQTISQPYIVALMSQVAKVGPGDRVLEIGTGSGYQAAVLASMGVEVYSIEILEPLARESDARLKALGYAVTVRHGDGYAGWPEKAPFDAIVVTAAPPQVPEPLKAQLTVGGRLVIPVGSSFQSLRVIVRTEEGYASESLAPVRFVPMTGEAQK